MVIPALIHKAAIARKKLDVFARQNREGFDGWGDEYKKLKTITKKPKKLAPKRQNKQGELKL